MTAGFRCGVVALLGRPNAGKSTLLNALLGEKLAITSARAQTTRGRILGVDTTATEQIVFYDTPGVHRGQARFNLAMTDAALEIAGDADLRLLLFDATGNWDTPEEKLAALPQPLILVRTKCDLREPAPVPSAGRMTQIVEISAHTGAGLERLREAIVAHLPEGPALYPADYLTDVPLRFLAAEQIREVVFDELRDEIPYSVAVEVSEWDEEGPGGSGAVRIQANLLVERESQKGIVIGSGGQMLGALGTEARARLAKLLDRPVHLKLWVKTDRNWTKKLRRVRQLGYL